jgi:hypothetical protein
MGKDGRFISLRSQSSHLSSWRSTVVLQIGLGNGDLPVKRRNEVWQSREFESLSVFYLVRVVVVVVTSVTTVAPSSQLDEQPDVLLLADEGLNSVEGAATAFKCLFSVCFNKVAPHS